SCGLNWSAARRPIRNAGTRRVREKGKGKSRSPTGLPPENWSTDERHSLRPSRARRDVDAERPEGQAGGCDPLGARGQRAGGSRPLDGGSVPRGGHVVEVVLRLAQQVRRQDGGRGGRVGADAARERAAQAAGRRDGA